MRQIDLEKIEQWSTGYGLSKEKCEETLVLCESLANTWFANYKHNTTDKPSFELALIDADGAEAEVLQGIDENNVGITIADILLTKSKAYASISLRAYFFDNGKKVICGVLGEMDIDKKC